MSTVIIVLQWNKLWMTKCHARPLSTLLVNVPPFLKNSGVALLFPDDKADKADPPNDKAPCQVGNDPGEQLQDETSESDIELV
jgi:hypothetical protein